MARSMSIYRQNGVDYIIDDPTIAPVFVASESYLEGEYVKHDGKLYKITAEHLANVSWSNTSKVEISIANELKEVLEELDDVKQTNNLADEWRNDLGYNIGDFVWHDGEYYTANTNIPEPPSGSTNTWNQNQWTKINIGVRIVENIKRTKESVDYAKRDILDNFANAFDAYATYQVGDIVFFSGDIARCIRSFVGDGTITPSNPHYWEKYETLVKDFANSDSETHGFLVETPGESATKQNLADYAEQMFIGEDNVYLYVTSDTGEARFDLIASSPALATATSVSVIDSTEYGEGKWIVGFRFTVVHRSSIDETFLENVSLKIDFNSTDSVTVPSSQWVSEDEFNKNFWFYTIATTDIDYIRVSLVGFDEGFIEDCTESSGQYGFLTLSYYTVINATGLSDNLCNKFINRQKVDYQTCDGDPISASLPSTYALDGTLTQTGKIPDSKAVGDAIAAVLPTIPSSDGTYVLEATVSSGITTLSWVAQAGEG